MSNSENNLRIDYVEFPATDIAATKRFYAQAFGWKFEDYGPDYTSFQDGRLAGGFTKVDLIQAGAPLVVIYTTDLEAAQARCVRRAVTSTAESSSFREAAAFTFSILMAIGSLSGRISRPRSEDRLYDAAQRRI